MRRRIVIIGIVLALVAALAAGVAVTRAHGESSLPPLTPSQLLAKVAEKAPQTTAVSGDFAWSNDLLGTGALQLPGGNAGLAALLQSGSGRLWYQDGKVRLEVQGQSGDSVMVLSGSTLWVYSSEKNTATEYTLPPMAKDGQAAPGVTSPIPGITSPGITGADLPTQIQTYLQKMASTATLTVSQEQVAGEASYVLTLSPTAANTVFGSVEVAFDGERFAPLQVQVMAKGDAKPVLSAGFTRVSYDPVAQGMFEFSPPSGAKVEHKTLSLPQDMTSGAPAPGTEGRTEAAPLTIDQAQAKAGFTLAVPADPPLPFSGAEVVPAHKDMGPVVVLKYGEGFGSVMVVETKVTDAQMTQLTKELSTVPVLGKPALVAGRPSYRIDTRLGSAVAWEQNGLVVLVAGSVPPADVTAFAAAIK